MANTPNLNKAIGLQSANILQKSQLDMMATKLILILKVQKDIWARIPKRTSGTAADLAEAMGEVGRILSMTRDECSAARSTGIVVYPDKRIQEIITRASDEIANVLLEDL